MAGALIITAEMDSGDRAWLDQLRRAHYPPARNQVGAHLTIFHALPPSSEREVRSLLTRCASEPAPAATIEAVMDLGSGVALRIMSDGLDRIRRELAEDLHGLLSAQDSGGWQPHVTIQNKVTRKEARALLTRLQSGFRRRPLGITGLGLYRYLDGPWEKLASVRFRGR